MKIAKTFLILLSVSGLCFGQFVEDENWIREIGGAYSNNSPFITYRYNNYTQEDVIKAKQKLKFIKQVAPKNQWEGIYSKGTEIGEAHLIWNLEGGFFDYYYYHELKSLNYGKVKDSLGLIELVSEKPFTSTPDKKHSVATENKLVKVKVGDRHFLVYENRVQAFAERAVGLNTSLGDYSYYWSKVEDYEKKAFGLPILPVEYKRFLRYPIEAKINGVGRKIIPNEQSTKEFNFDDIHYQVTLNAGKNKNIKIGMNFFVEELGEWTEIIKVFQKSSIGKIRREFGEGNQEQCFDSESGQGQFTPCKEIKVGMKAKTKASEMYF